MINSHMRRDDEKQRAMQAGMQLQAANRLQTKPLITTYTFDDINQVFYNLVPRKHGNA